MKKGIAVSILTTMVLGLAAWAGSNISKNTSEIAKLKVHKQYMHNDIREIKADVKKLLERVR